jgi:hypothetical protein
MDAVQQNVMERNLPALRLKIWNHGRLEVARESSSDGGQPGAVSSSEMSVQINPYRSSSDSLSKRGRRARASLIVKRGLWDMVRCQIVALDALIGQLVITANVTRLQRLCTLVACVGVDYRPLVRWRGLQVLG